MIHKRILVPGRVRRPPTDGWSWIDRRFVRDFAPRLSHEAIALYFFLAAVADKDGLSFYHDATVAGRLRISEESLACAGRVDPRRPGGLPHAVDAGAFVAAATGPTTRR